MGDLVDFETFVPCLSPYSIFSFIILYSVFGTQESGEKFSTDETDDYHIKSLKISNNAEIIPQNDFTCVQNVSNKVELEY